MCKKKLNRVNSKNKRNLLIGCFWMILSIGSSLEDWLGVLMGISY